MIKNIGPEAMFLYPQEALEFSFLNNGFEFYRAKGLVFTEGVDDLDDFMAACIELSSGKHLRLVARHTHPVHSNSVTVFATADDNNPINSLDEFLEG